LGVQTTSQVVYIQWLSGWPMPAFHDPVTITLTLDSRSDASPAAPTETAR